MWALAAGGSGEYAKHRNASAHCSTTPSDKTGDVRVRLDMSISGCASLALGVRGYLVCGVLETLGIPRESIRADINGSDTRTVLCNLREAATNARREQRRRRNPKRAECRKMKADRLRCGGIGGGLVQIQRERKCEKECGEDVQTRDLRTGRGKGQEEVSMLSHYCDVNGRREQYATASGRQRPEGAGAQLRVY